MTLSIVFKLAEKSHVASSSRVIWRLITMFPDEDPCLTVIWAPKQTNWDQSVGGFCLVDCIDVFKGRAEHISLGLFTSPGCRVQWAGQNKDVCCESHHYVPISSRSVYEWGGGSVCSGECTPLSRVWHRTRGRCSFWWGGRSRLPEKLLTSTVSLRLSLLRSGFTCRRKYPHPVRQGDNAVILSHLLFRLTVNNSEINKYKFFDKDEK